MPALAFSKPTRLNGGRPLSEEDEDHPHNTSTTQHCHLLAFGTAGQSTYPKEVRYCPWAPGRQVLACGFRLFWEVLPVYFPSLKSLKSLSFYFYMFENHFQYFLNKQDNKLKNTSAFTEKRSIYSVHWSS